jgi:hypothetical protein
MSWLLNLNGQTLISIRRQNILQNRKKADLKTFLEGGVIKVYYFFLLQYYDENYARVFHIYCTGTFNLKAHPRQF